MDVDEPEGSAPSGNKEAGKAASKLQAPLLNLDGPPPAIGNSSIKKRRKRNKKKEDNVGMRPLSRTSLISITLIG